jgi:nucleoside-diphosphate-sugar epimerase
VASEESPTNPLTAYARSKWLTERDLADLADGTFTVTSLRFGTACGMSPRLRLDLVLNDFAASAVALGRIVLLSDGTAWRPLIHVRDMARAVDWAAGRDPDDGGEFLAINVGSDEWNYRIRDLAEEVAEVTGSDVSYAPGGDPDRRSYRVDFHRYRMLAPDHQPVVGLREAVEDLRDGLVDIGFADPDFRRSRFARLVVLRELQERGLLDERLQWAGASRVQATVP